MQMQYGISSILQGTIHASVDSKSMNLLLPACLILGLYGPYRAGRILIRNREALSLPGSKFDSRPLPWASYLLALAIAIPSTLQFFFSPLLSTLRRDHSRFTNGEWWRLITPLFVQDAGIVGVAFNLISLLLIGAVAEQLWGGKRMVGIFFAGGIVGEIVAFAWQPIGAGNSVGNFSVAASVAVVCLAERSARASQLLAWLALAAIAVLFLRKDIHGVAGLAGIALALVLLRPAVAQRSLGEL
jgi:membrane associated rhomboid family serine protease